MFASPANVSDNLPRGHNTHCNIFVIDLVTPLRQAAKKFGLWNPSFRFGCIYYFLKYASICFEN